MRMRMTVVGCLLMCFGVVEDTIQQLEAFMDRLGVGKSVKGT